MTEIYRFVLDLDLCGFVLIRKNEMTGKGMKIRENGVWGLTENSHIPHYSFK